MSKKNERVSQLLREDCVVAYLSKGEIGENYWQYDLEVLRTSMEGPTPIGSAIARKEANGVYATVFDPSWNGVDSARSGSEILGSSSSSNSKKADQTLREELRKRGESLAAQIQLPFKFLRRGRKPY